MLEPLGLVVREIQVSPPVEDGQRPSLARGSIELVGPGHTECAGESVNGGRGEVPCSLARSVHCCYPYQPSIASQPIQFLNRARQYCMMQGGVPLCKTGLLPPWLHSPQCCLHDDCIGMCIGMVFLMPSTAAAAVMTRRDFLQPCEPCPAWHCLQADGHCMYKAVEDQLRLNAVDGDKAQQPDFKKLRHMTAQHMREHKAEFLPFLSQVGPYWVAQKWMLHQAWLRHPA